MRIPPVDHLSGDPSWRDEQLMKAFREGNLRAFDALYDIHYPQLLTHISRGMGPRYWASAEDVTQKTFCLVIQNKNVFNPARGSFKVWLYSIANNQRKGFFRSLGRAKVFLHDTLIPKDSAPIGILDNDGKIFLAECLRKLTARERQVIDLMFYDGFTARETAQILGVREGTVWSTQSKAVEKLRKFSKTKCKKLIPNELAILSKSID